MIFFKNKRSFFIIEILLGIFLLGIFLTGLIATPKAAYMSAVEGLCFVEAKHVADQTWLDIYKNLDVNDLPQEKTTSLSIPLDPVSFTIHSKLSIQFHRSASITCIETKYEQKQPVSQIYECKINIETKIQTKPLIFTYPYRFILKK